MSIAESRLTGAHPERTVGSRAHEEESMAAGALTGGLEGIVVAETELSDVDGERGELIIRG